MTQDIPNAGRLLQQLDELFAPHNRADAPGVVVAIARQGELLYRRAFGMASIEHGVANTPKTRMRIGSTTKQFTCLATLLLAEEGKLDIDAGVDRYDPEMPKLSGYPTLRQLMNHSSGYRDTQEIAFNAAGLTVQPKGRILAALRAQSGVVFKPGQGQLYCNAAYYLLSEIIARVSGMSFEDFLRERIFAPLKMNDTVSLPGDMDIVADMATLHLPRPDGSWRRGILVNEETSGCGSIVSTIDDLLKWTDNLHRRHRLGSKDSWEAMLQPTMLDSGVEVGYGLGLYHHDYRGVKIIHHAGGVIGGNSQMLVVPDEDLDIVIMSNTDGIPSAGLAMQALEILLGERLLAPTTPAKSTGLEHLFGRRYRHERGLVIGFDDVSGFLGVSAQLSPHAPVLRDEGEFLRARWEDVGMGPLDFPKDQLSAQDNGGAPARLQLLEGGYPREFTLMDEGNPAAAELPSTMVGEYYCDDMDSYARIHWDGSNLNMNYAGRYGAREMALDIVSMDVLGVTCLDPVAPVRYSMTLERQDQHICGFAICSTRARDLHFRRLPPRRIPTKDC